MADCEDSGNCFCFFHSDNDVLLDADGKGLVCVLFFGPNLQKKELSG